MGCRVLSLSLFAHHAEDTHGPAAAPLRAKHLSLTPRLSSERLCSLMSELDVSDAIVARWAGDVSKSLVHAWRHGKSIAPERAEMILLGAAAWRAARGM